jgi:hypothetical protein
MPIIVVALPSQHAPAVLHLWPAILCRSMEPGLNIASHPGYQQLCTGLRQAGCCATSWAMLAAATARQLCRDSLAEQLLLLPVGCGISDAPCIEDQQDALQQLLRKRSDCVRNAYNSSSSPSAGTADTGSAGTLDYWSGAACTALQRSRARCPQSTCDLWCGYISDVEAAGGSGQPVVATCNAYPASCRAGMMPCWCQPSSRPKLCSRHRTPG